MHMQCRVSTHLPLIEPYCINNAYNSRVKISRVIDNKRTLSTKLKTQFYLCTSSGLSQQLPNLRGEE